MDAPVSSRPLPQLSNRFSRFFRRFSLRRPTADIRARWQVLDAEGAALERLMASPDWVVLERRKEVAQRLRDVVLHTPQATDAMRYQAALEWTVLQEWFRDLRAVVREGQKAREALQRLKPQDDEVSP